MSKDLKIVASNVPATSFSIWPSPKKVKQLADGLDGVVDADKGMIAAKNELARRPLDAASLERAKKEADYYAQHRSEIISSELKKLKKECEPDGWWEGDEDDEDGGVRQSEVAKMVAKLVGSWPTSNIPEPAVFVRALIEDVMALDPTFVAFESACRKLRRELKFMPSIAEVVAEIERQESEWHERTYALLFIGHSYANLVKQIAESETAIAAEEERRKRQLAAAEEERERQREQQRKYAEAKAAALVVGDRVRTNPWSTGVITKPFEGDCDAWYVLFDNDDEWFMMAEDLEKLVEGDEGFAPPPDFG
jgi:uncharacterized membrane-anchored protein YhcB (DUF1043 family)